MSHRRSRHRSAIPGQVFVGHRHCAASGAVDDRNRRAPVTLTAYAPVAQAEVHLLAAGAVVFEEGEQGVEGTVEVEAVVVAGIDQAAVLGVGGFLYVYYFARLQRLDHLLDRQAIALGKFMIAFIVCRHRHHGTGAVRHQHEVGGPDRHLLAGDRVDGPQASVARSASAVLMLSCFLMKAASAGLVSAARSASGCWAATAQ